MRIPEEKAVHQSRRRCMWLVVLAYSSLASTNPLPPENSGFRLTHYRLRWCTHNSLSSPPLPIATNRKRTEWGRRDEEEERQTQKKRAKRRKCRSVWSYCYCSEFVVVDVLAPRVMARYRQWQINTLAWTRVQEAEQKRQKVEEKQNEI